MPKSQTITEVLIQTLLQEIEKIERNKEKLDALNGTSKAPFTKEELFDMGISRESCPIIQPEEQTLTWREAELKGLLSCSVLYPKTKSIRAIELDRQRDEDPFERTKMEIYRESVEVKKAAKIREAALQRKLKREKEIKQQATLAKRQAKKVAQEERDKIWRDNQEKRMRTYEAAKKQARELIVFKAFAAHGPLHELSPEIAQKIKENDERVEANRKKALGVKG